MTRYIPSLDHTHDPAHQAWIPSAQQEGHDFPVQNLPLGVFRRTGDPATRVGVAIGDAVLDLREVAETSLAGAVSSSMLRAPDLTALLGAGPQVWRGIRHWLFDLLSRSENPGLGEQCVVAQDEVEMCLPCAIGDYTDFYASIHHATNVGRMFRPDQPLLPNYRHLPVGYHGRASSLVVSGTAVRRPRGQLPPGESDQSPGFGPSRLLDYECEVGLLVGGRNDLGTPVPIEQAASRIFGFCLVNDWSARDIQRWEYQPLGPFLGKSFATSLSPWIVTSEALTPYRVPASRPAGAPPLLPYLQDAEDARGGGIDLTLDVYLETATMRGSRIPPFRVSRSRFADLYWTSAQMVTHHASNGCNLRPGDLLASGTVSGAAPETRGCLLERTWKGTEPLELPTGETRRFLEDGDAVVLRGACEAPGRVRIGFGVCQGEVRPAL